MMHEVESQAMVPRGLGYSLSVNTETVEWQRAVDAAYADMRENIDNHLYGDRDDDEAVVSKPPRYPRIALLVQRVSDAWAVLCGRAFIG